MATSSNYFCSLCQEDDETSTAVTWCAECEVFLCPECQKHHGRSKTSKQHQVMSLHDYHNLPKFMMKVKNNCEDHDMKYELFCYFHDAACCVKCMKDKHGDCKGLVPLVDVVGNIKSSAHVSKVEKDLSYLIENLITIKKHFSDNLESLQKQKIEAKEKVYEMRKSINEHLDKLGKCVLIDIESEFTKTRDMIKSLKDDIERKSDQIEQKQRDFSNIIEFSTDLQTYFGLHEVEKSTKDEEKYINDLKSSDILREKKIKVELLFDLESTIRESTTFGKVTTYLSPHNLQLKTKGEGQVQLQQNKVLDQIKTTIKQRFEMQKGSNIISGCQILPTGDVVFVNQGKKCILLFNHAGGFVREIVNVQSSMSDICYVHQKEVAVTLPNEKRVILVDFERNKIVKQTDVDGECFGICTNEQMIYVRVLPYTVLVLDLDFNVKNRIPLSGSSITRIAVFRDNIYCTDWKSNTVLCYNKAGEIVWSYTPDCNAPSGIDVDRNGFVYVACRSSSKLIVLSQDGTESKVIVSADDSDLENPFAINIDREMSLILISNTGDKSFLFSI